MKNSASKVLWTDPSKQIKLSSGAISSLHQVFVVVKINKNKTDMTVTSS